MTSIVDTPILILIFNRPDKVRILIERLSKFKPRNLYISADGPRKERPGEKELCLEAQSIATTVDWPCVIHTNFSEENLGCKRGVSKGINWFFENVEAGIILEDDCLPNEAFLTFTTTLLERYRDNDQVMHINGTSFLPATRINIDEPFFFSRLAHSWGWATWRRAWNKFDGDMNELPNLSKILTSKQVFLNRTYLNFWVKHFNHIKNNQVDSWANPWLFSVLINNGVCITPKVNLIENIGFDIEATNTKSKPGFSSTALDVKTLIYQPAQITVNTQADAKITNLVFKKGIFFKLQHKFKKWYDTTVNTAQNLS